MIFVSCGLRFDLLDLCVFFLPKSTIKKNFPKTRFFTYLEDPGIYIYNSLFICDNDNNDDNNIKHIYYI